MIWTKWTSAASCRPASSIAARTPAATTAITWRLAAEMLGRKISGPRRADGERRPRRVVGGRRPAFQDEEVRRQRAFRAAGHDVRDPSGRLRADPRGEAVGQRRTAKARVKSLTQPLPSVLPSTATTDDGSIRPARGGLQRRHVVGRVGLPGDEGPAHRHPITAREVVLAAHAPNTPPCMVTMSMAARGGSRLGSPRSSRSRAGIRSRGSLASRMVVWTQTSGRDAGQHDVADALEAEDHLEIRRAEGALARLVDEVSPGRGASSGMISQPGSPRTRMPPPAPGRRCRRRSAGPPTLVGGQVREIRPMALPRVNDGVALRPHRRHQARDRLDRRARQRDVVAPCSRRSRPCRRSRSACR